MEAALASAQEKETVSPETGERRCLISGKTLPKDDLIRFVIDPNGNVVPDLAQKLPGRGLWVKADSSAITEAAKKGLFAKAAKTSAKAAPNLAEQVISLLRARCLSLIGLAKSAGATVLGETQVAEALRTQKLALLLLADDASSEPGHLNNVPVCRLFARGELGAALGYAQIVYAGIKPHGLTSRLKTDLQRLRNLLETTTLAIQGNG